MNVMKRMIRLFISVCACVVLLYSCVDTDDFDVNRISQTTINPEIEANIMTMDFAARDFFGQIENLEEGIHLVDGEDGVLHLQMMQDFEVNGSDLAHDFFNKNVEMHLADFNLNDITIPSWYDETFTDDIVLDEQTLLISIDEFAKYDEDEESRAIDSLVLATGTFVFAGHSQLPYDAQVYIQTNSIVKDGKAFSQVLNMKANKDFSEVIDLAGYTLKLDAQEDNTSEISLSYKIVVKTAGQSIYPGDYGLSLSLDGKDLNIDLAYGRVGNPSIPMEGVLDIDYFDSTISTDMLNLEKISMFVDVKNYTGIKLFLDMTKIKAINHQGVVSDLFDKEQRFEVEPAGKPGEMKLTQNVLNINPDILSHLPNQISYELSSIFGDGTQRGFIYPNKKYVDVHTILDIPLSLRVNDFVSEKETDALDFLNSEDGVGDYIDSVILKVGLENSFPAALKIDLFTKDASGQVMPLLANSVDVVSAEVDNNGNVTAASINTQEISITQESYQRLKDAQSVLIRATFNTSGTGTTKPFVKFTGNEKMKVKLGVRAHTVIKF